MTGRQIEAVARAISLSTGCQNCSRLGAGDCFYCPQHAKAALAALREQAEPVAIVERADHQTAAALVGDEPPRIAVKELREGALQIGTHLYATPQPDPEVLRRVRDLYGEWLDLYEHFLMVADDLRSKGKEVRARECVAQAVSFKNCAEALALLDAEQKENADA